jgi:glycosyltransferase involved in cell wall biosynthesis
MTNQYPIFIICRDRVSCTRQLVNWLEQAGQERIYFVDNGSTYEPLLEYYETTPHTVVRLGSNYGHTSAWNTGVLEKYAAGEHFVVTDPDIIPSEECPLDAIDHFRTLLDRYPHRTKAGFALRIDDLPDHFKFKQQVINYESQFFNHPQPEPGAYYAPIDTTFALYSPGADADISFSIRTGAPYWARHTPWYLDSDNLDPEEIYYREHMNKAINSWNKDELPGWYRG